MHIAVLEDDPAQAELLQSWLTAAGHQCTLFGLGNNLVSALPAAHFDLLILDWNLPDISGTEVLEWARDNMDWHIPVIFITCRDTEQDIVKALDVCGFARVDQPALVLPNPHSILIQFLEKPLSHSPCMMHAMVFHK